MTQPVTQDPLYDLLRSYQTKGLPVLPLWGIDPKTLGCLCFQREACKASKGKHPTLVQNGAKNASTAADVLKYWVNRNRLGNWGIGTGFPLPSGGHLIVLDVDPRNGGDDSLADLETKHGKLPHTLTALSGGGGVHYFLRAPSAVQGRTVSSGLDLKGTNGYIVCAPSRHGSGGIYQWDSGSHIDDTEIADAPAWLCNNLDNQLKLRPLWNGRSAKESYLGAAFETAGMLGVSAGNGIYCVKCPQVSLHTDGRGDGKDTSTVLLPPIEGTDTGTFVCLHSNCSNMNWQAVVGQLPPTALAAARAKYPFKPRLVAQTASAIVTTAPPTAASDGSAPNDTDAVIPAPDPTPDVWGGMLVKMTKSGAVAISDVCNVNHVLSADPRWLHDRQSIIRFDEFRQQIKFVTPPPWHPDDAPATAHEYWQDEDTTRLISYIRRHYDFAVPDQMAYQAVRVVAKRQTVHPVREYLASLTWDKTPRVETWLSKYLGVEDTSYSRSIAKWWLISAVARATREVKADYILILEGPQGIKKSTALAKLCPRREWFSDTPFDLGTKDSYLGLRGKWIVELAELDALTRADASKAKAFFSSQTDTYRPPYGRESIEVPRQCVFAGTVNLDTYLKDETGARRYWPVRCGVIDIPGIEAVRDQLWAEAAVLYRAGELWYPDTMEEHLTFSREQETRSEVDAWTEVIEDWLKKPEATLVETQWQGIRGIDLAERALQIEIAHYGRVEQLRVARCMRSLGWKSVNRKLDNGKQTRIWSKRFVE